MGARKALKKKGKIVGYYCVVGKTRYNYNKAGKRISRTIKD